MCTCLLIFPNVTMTWLIPSFGLIHSRNNTNFLHFNIRSLCENNILIFSPVIYYNRYKTTLECPIFGVHGLHRCPSSSLDICYNDMEYMHRLAKISMKVITSVYCKLRMLTSTFSICEMFSLVLTLIKPQ